MWRYFPAGIGFREADPQGYNVGTLTRRVKIHQKVGLLNLIHKLAVFTQISNFSINS